MLLQLRPLAIVCADCLAGSKATEAENLIVNGSFESPAIAANTSQALVPTSWTGSGVNIINGNYSPGYPLPREGQQYLSLGNSESAFSQTFAITNAGTYPLNWYHSSEFNGPGSSSPYTVSVTNSAMSVIASESFESNAIALRAWALQSLTLALVPDTYTIFFQSNTSPFGQQSPMIDNVRLDVSEPTSIACVFVGGMLLVTRVRRR